MPWKKDDKGALAVDPETGNPVFEQEGDGKTTIVDYQALMSKMAQSNKGEEKYRKELSELKKRLEPLAGVDDYAAHAKAHSDLIEENARLKENTDASKIEERVQVAKGQIEKAWLDKEKAWKAQTDALNATLKTKDAEMSALRGDMSRERIRSMFNDSAYVKEKCALTPAILFDLFNGKATLGEDGKFNGFDPGQPGEVLLGSDGNPASFDHWLHKIIEAHPDSKTMLRGTDFNNPAGTPKSGAPGYKNPWAKDSFSVTEQHVQIGKDVEAARNLARAAGVNPSF